MRQKRRDGRDMILASRLQLIRGADGVERVLEISRDITETKQEEARLQQAQKLESIGLLAGGVAHDFNNLLVGILGNASLAQDMLSREHPVSALLGRVIKASEQAAHLVKQLLAYAGKGRFVVEPVDLSGVVEDVCTLVQPAISKKVSLQLDLKQGLPPVEADRSQMQQVMMNLVLNASEAIGDRAGTISIRTGIEEIDERRRNTEPACAELAPGRYLCLEVHDTGSGMDEAIKEKIFDPFFTTKFTGRGLGLAAVSGIVRGHRGAVLVETAPGKGSCFKVLLPAANGAANLPLPTATPPAKDVRGTGTVLVVDDEESVRETAKEGLERYGYHVLLAPDGPSAIGVAQDQAGREHHGFQRVQRGGSATAIHRRSSYRLHSEAVHRPTTRGQGEASAWSAEWLIVTPNHLGGTPAWCPGGQRALGYATPRCIGLEGIRTDNRGA